MSSKQNQKQKQKQKQKHAEEEQAQICDFCLKKGEKLLKCGGCGLVAYCNAGCQKSHWGDHRGTCKQKQKEKKEREAKEEARSSGSGLGDMGSVLNALMPPPPPQRITEVDVWNACLQGKHGELDNMVQQIGLDLNWAEPDGGTTAAYISAQEGHVQCLSLLGLHKADLSKATKIGWAPIHIACQNGRLDCIEVLCDHGIDANVRTADEYGNTPAIISSQNGHVKCLALVSDRGADLNLADNFGNTVVHKASQYGHLKILFLLVSRRANLNKKNKYGETPLDIARRYKQRECIDLLLANGAVGMSVEDLPPVPEAAKVCMSASFIRCFV